MDHDTGIQDADYLRQRLQPRPGDPDYLHLSDLIVALSKHRSDEQISVLDYGCGGSPYRSLFPNAIYKRADFHEMADLDYVIGNDSRVPEADDKFDLILSTQVAEHVSSPGTYFSECSRLLKVGGKLICTTHGTYPDHGCPFDFQRWTADGLKRDLRAAEFEVEECLKLTTNARAMMYFIQRFSGWFDSRSAGAWSFPLRIYRSGFHRYPNVWHRSADRLFSANAVVDAADEGHEFYIGLLVVARKQNK